MEVFYFGLALSLRYVEGFVKGYLEMTGEDEPDEEDFLRGLCEDTDRDFVLYRPSLFVLGGLPVLLQQHGSPLGRRNLVHPVREVLPRIVEFV